MCTPNQHNDEGHPNPRSDDPGPYSTRVGITLVWGGLCALPVILFTKDIVVSPFAGAVLALLLGVWLYVADGLGAPIRRRQMRQAGLVERMSTWIVLYEVFPAVLLFSFGSTVTGLFCFPSSVFTALAICLPLSLSTLREYVNLSWCRRV